MNQNGISLETILENIKHDRLMEFIPRVKSFEGFNNLASLCAELARGLDNYHDNPDKSPRGELEPYCGAELASAMATLAKQLTMFKYKDKDSEEYDELCYLMDDYLTGVLPFVRLARAYKASEQLSAFMSEYPDPANVEISDEALGELPKTFEIPDEPCDTPDGGEEYFDYDEFPGDPYFDGAEDYDDEDCEWYNEPNAWLFSDEESYLEFKVQQMELLSDREYEEACKRADPTEILFKMSPCQIHFAKSFAREYFLAKAIDLCAVDESDLYKESAFEFPKRDFSPEARREIEEHSTKGFVKLYGKIASDESLKNGIALINKALKGFEEKIVRRYETVDRV